MNDTQLQRGNELQKQLSELKDQIEKWKEAKGFWMIRLSKSVGGGTDDLNNIWTKHIDFEVMKTLTLKKLNDNYTELETEYNNL